MPAEKQKQPVQPRDGRIVSLILQSLGVEQYDPKVVPQLLEFAHRYTSDVIQDALVYAEHANKNDLDIDDIQLAIHGRVHHSFTNPPPKELLLELAHEKNKVPLPLIPEKYGIRLPAEKHCLTGLNFAIIPDAPHPPQTTNEKPFSPSNEPSESAASPYAMDSDVIMQTPMSQTQPISASPMEGVENRGMRQLMEEDDYDI
ncbi:hypothetical protein VTP01DRAFT_5392 [Rhizomucor pusillus]|uniref:uncharacterized protein n=1 Tax=Rhizomucor pusillus TaxID=4840 RepID=UPI003742AF5A